jgi:hypothetical protein
MLGEKSKLNDRLVQELRAMCISAGLGGFERQTEALLGRPEVETLLPKIGCPTLVLVGREDAWSTVEQHRAIAGAVRGAQLDIIDQAGHMMPAEQPHKFNAIVQTWMASRSRPRPRGNLPNPWLERASQPSARLEKPAGTVQICAMTQHSFPSRLAALARAEWVEISRVNLSRRPWQMPCVAGLTAALPVALGAWLGGFSQGLLAALGTMVFVYITDTTLERRLLTLMGMSFAITACFALGLVAAQIHLAAVPVIVTVTMLVSMGCRYLRLGPPAALFRSWLAPLPCLPMSLGSRFPSGSD